MGNLNDPTTIPRVPIQTPMFEPVTGKENLENQFTSKWELSRTWIIFFERIFKGKSGKGQGGPYQRTLLLKDTTPGSSIADHTTAWVDGKGLRLTGVLRKAITADLHVQLWKVDHKNTGAGFQKVIELTIPQARAVNSPLDSKTFTSKTLQAVNDGDVFRWDVVSSDSSKDLAGVASFTYEWEAVQPKL